MPVAASSLNTQGVRMGWFRARIVSGPQAELYRMSKRTAPKPCTGPEAASGQDHALRQGRHHSTTYSGGLFQRPHRALLLRLFADAHRIGIGPSCGLHWPAVTCDMRACPRCFSCLLSYVRVLPAHAPCLALFCSCLLALSG